MQVKNHTHNNLDEIAEKIYLEATKSAGSYKELLRRISRSYGNKTFIQSNGSFDASVEILQASCQLLAKHKIEASRLKEEYENNFEQAWNRHSLLIGNLKDCIELVIDKTKKTIGESFLTSSPRRLVNKTDIFSVRLTESVYSQSAIFGNFLGRNRAFL